MKIFVCLDDQNGLSFNGRRQSMDKAVREKIVTLLDGAPLWMNAYSATQFVDFPAQIFVDEQFLEKTDTQDFCFVETCVFSFEDVFEVFIFRWNRVYPADVTLDLHPIEENFSLVSTEDFPGNSHEKIMLEIYRRIDV